MIKIINLASSKKQFPVIYKNKDSYLPILGPLIYSTTKLNSKAFGTIRNQLEVLDTFYQFFEGKTQELDQLLFTGAFQGVFEHLYEYLNVYLPEKVRRIKSTSNESQIGYKAHVIKTYLHWSLSRYIHSDHNQVKRIDKVIQSFQVRLNSICMLLCKKMNRILPKLR